MKAKGLWGKTRGALARPQARWGLMAALVGLTAISSSALPVTNGGFDTGLTAWNTEGDVQGTTDAVLGDDAFDYSLLYQGVAAGPGQYRLEFDFLNALSPDVPAGGSAFPDAFLASLYFIDDLNAFDLANGVFDYAAALMDMDAAGPYNVMGTLSSSGLGQDWTHFTIDFSNAYAYVIPTFELLNFNATSADSHVRIDNVSIAPLSAVVPEPATMTLFSIGLAATIAAHRKRRTRIGVTV